MTTKKIGNTVLNQDERAMPDRDMDCVKEADVNDSDEEDIAAIENAENEPEDHSKKQKQRSTPPADSSTDLVKALWINRNKKEALLKAICKRTPQNTVACPLCPADFLDMQHLLRHLCTSAHFLHQIKALRRKEMEQFLELGNQKCPSCGVHVARKNRGSLIRHFGVCHGDAMDLALEAARKVEDSIAEELKSANSLPADATTVVPPPHSPPPSGAVSPAPSPPAHPCSDVPFEPGSLLHPAAAHAPPPEPQHTVPAHAPPHPSTVLLLLSLLLLLLLIIWALLLLLLHPVWTWTWTATRPPQMIWVWKRKMSPSLASPAMPNRFKRKT